MQPKTSAWRSNRRERWPKTSQKKTARRAEDRRRLDDLGRPGRAGSAGTQGRPAIQRFGDRAELGRQRHHSQAAQEEEPEEGQVPVGDVADLVAEDRGDLDAG